MTSVYFDVTDIVHFASRYSRVTGIQRVQLNIVTLLAHKQAPGAIRCIFFDRARKAIFEFDPAQRPADFEFDAERFLADIGLARPSKIFPSKVRIKSYLRQYNNNKLLRTLKKIDVYLSSMIMRGRLANMGLSPPDGRASPAQNPVSVSRIVELPPGSRYVSLGAAWFTPEMWRFAQAHRDRGGDVVQMVYDLIPILHPEYYSSNEPPAYAAWLDSALKYAARFICISRWTAGDLRKYAESRGHYPMAEAIPLAHEFIGFERFSSIDTPSQLASLSGVSFVLCVGTIEHRKNGIALLKVWRDLKQELGEKVPLLVFVGKFGKGGAEFQAFLEKHSGLSQCVRVIHAPSDRDLVWLYRNCLFTTFPSQIEGWGLPVGEAAWFGKFCVTSKATSMPEVCGDLADYVDPYDVENMKAGLRRPIVDADYLKQREQRIAAARLRRWEEVADDIYKFVISA